MLEFHFGHQAIATGFFLRSAQRRSVFVADQFEGSMKEAVLVVDRRLERISSGCHTISAISYLQYSGRRSSGWVSCGVSLIL